MKAIDQLPTYVSSSPDNMPNLRLYEGDVHVLLSLLKTMDGRMSEFESAVAAISRDVTALQMWPTLPDHSQPPVTVQSTARAHTRDINIAEPAESAQRRVTGQSGQSRTQPTVDRVGNSTTGVSFLPDGDHLASDWAEAVVSTPYASANRYDALCSITTDDDDPQQPFEQPRRSSRRRRRSSSQQPSSRPQTTNAQHQRRGPLVLGKAKNGSFISAARKQRKKTVLCVDNVIRHALLNKCLLLLRRCLLRYLRALKLNLDADLMRMSTMLGTRKHVVSADELDQLLAAEVWPEYVTVSSSRADLNDRVNNKRPRIGNDHEVGRCIHQLSDNTGRASPTLQSVNDQDKPAVSGLRAIMIAISTDVYYNTN